MFFERKIKIVLKKLEKKVFLFTKKIVLIEKGVNNGDISSYFLEKVFYFINICFFI